MPIPILATLLLSGLLLFSAPATAAATEDSQTIAVGAFHKLRVDGNAEVTLQPGDTETVTVRGSENQHRDVRVDIEVRDGELHIRTRPHDRRLWWQALEPERSYARITVVFRSLDQIELAGAVRLRADALRAPRLVIAASCAVSIRVNDLRGDELRLRGSGAMKAHLAGHVGTQEIVMAGAGKYDAPDLVSDDARVDVSGAGKVIVHADKTLRVTLSGAGAVDYLGEPRITREISGAGRLRPYKS